MSVGSTLDERYFEWLYSLVADIDDRDPTTTHWNLCKRLYLIPFRWFIARDDNRADDGSDLRYEYLSEYDDEMIHGWLDLDTSIFEMMIALARRAAYQTDQSPSEWFWIMLDNLELSKYVDDVYHRGIDNAVSKVMDRVMDREYEYSGRGGFFPLRDPERDQRWVEIWYQLSAYLLEKIEY